MTQILNNDSFVTSLALVAMKNLGEEALTMDPLIVRDAMEEILGIQQMPQRMFDKLNCGLTLLGTEAYTKTIEGFLQMTACMNGDVLESDVASMCTIEDCAWGVWEYINLNGDITTDGKPSEEFSEDIKVYIREAAKLEGLYKLPNWLSFAEPVAALPDLTDDMNVFNIFMSRQEDTISTMNKYVTDRMAELSNELNRLRVAGYVG